MTVIAAINDRSSDYDLSGPYGFERSVVRCAESCAIGVSVIAATALMACSPNLTTLFVGVVPLFIAGFSAGKHIRKAAERSTVDEMLNSVKTS